jgi:hypothetical protein
MHWVKLTNASANVLERTPCYINLDNVVFMRDVNFSDIGMSGGQVATGGVGSGADGRLSYAYYNVMETVDQILAKEPIALPRKLPPAITKQLAAKPRKPKATLGKRK